MKHEQALALSLDAAPQNVNFDGLWQNELLSTMELQIRGDMVSGRYKSKVSGTGDVIEGNIVGCVSGHIISLIVNWPNASVTSWIGHLVREAAEPTIETLWNLATPTEDPNDPTQLWESIFSGSDRFYRPD